VVPHLVHLVNCFEHLSELLFTLVEAAIFPQGLEVSFPELLLSLIALWRSEVVLIFGSVEKRV
jgi:hypothetical protein